MAAWKTDYTDFDLARDFDYEFDYALQQLRVESSVGECPMKNFGSTISQALKYNLDVYMKPSFDKERVAYLKELVRDRLTKPLTSDPIKVFIKQEPHKLQKIAEGRWRLISAVSLVDTMCDRIVFQRLTRKIMTSVMKTPALIGWSPVRSGHLMLSSMFSGKKTRGLDKKAWDWTVSGWALKAILQVLKDLCLNLPSEVERWMNSRWCALFRDAVFQFADGTQIQQPGWGVMKSGCYLTIVINSIGQLLHHALAQQFVPQADVVKVVLGDDMTLEDFDGFQHYESVIKENGALLKPSEATNYVTFAGFVMYQYRMYPEYWQKHLYNITHKNLETVTEALESYLVIYAFDETFGAWLRTLAAKLMPERMRSRRECVNILNLS